MPARKKTTTSVKDDETMSFEASLEKIETIVESMEGDQLPLEDLVSQYEKGSELLKHCESVLASARKRIELITLANREDDDTEHSEDPNTLTNASSENDGGPEDYNDSSLF
jgi:exodeoxyribonuclease VII small subunit